MASNKPLVIRLTKDAGGWPKGTELGVDRESDAQKLYSDGYKIVSYQDGGAYEPPAPEPAKPSEASA